MSRQKMFQLVAAAVAAATLIASAAGYGPIASEIRSAVCGESVN